MNMIWISQEFQYNREMGTIGFTSRNEILHSLNKLGNFVLLITGASLKNVLRRSKLLDYPRVVYLPMYLFPFLTTITFQFALLISFPFLLLKYRARIIISDYFSVFTLSPFLLLKKIGLLKTSFILDIRTLAVDTKGLHGKITNTRFKYSLLFAKVFFDGITVITPAMKRYIVENLQFEEENIGIWSSGVNYKKFSTANSRRDEFGWSDKFIVMYHGTFSPNRGLQEVIRAFCVLKNECPDTRLIMLGDGIGRREFNKLVSDCQLEDYVYILGPISYEDIPDYVASVDIGIIPLPDIDWWNTSSPMKLFEYLAAGKPVILSPIEAHKNVIRDHPIAYYLADVTEQEIAKGIKYLYDRRQNLESTGKTGQDLVKDQYTWDAQAERLSEFVYYILNN